MIQILAGLAGATIFGLFLCCLMLRSDMQRHVQMTLQAQDLQAISEARFDDHRKQMTEFLARPNQINFNSEEIASILTQKIGILVNAPKEWKN